MKQKAKTILYARRVFCPAIMAAIAGAAMWQGCAQTERAETATAEITAAQMQGRNSARQIINRHWKDTSDLVLQLQAVRRQKCRFDSTGHPECAAAFDSAFIQTLRAVKPELEKIAVRF